jgi:hypothetical protein
MFEPVLTTVCTIVIERPVGRVREQFHDLKHASKQSTHSGLTIEHLPPRAPGEQRVRMKMRLLGVPQVDEIVQTFEEGVLVSRYVDGPNKGTMFRKIFTPLGPDRTRVDFVAVVPVRGAKRVLGKVIERIVKTKNTTALAEHKRDLEAEVV